MYFVAVDIGCIECGEKSHVLGVFTDIDKAQSACDEHYARQQAHWLGQHHFEVFDVPEIDVMYKVDYT